MHHREGFLLVPGRFSLAAFAFVVLPLMHHTMHLTDFVIAMIQDATNMSKLQVESKAAAKVFLPEAMPRWLVERYHSPEVRKI